MLIRPLEERDREDVEKIFNLYWQDDFRNNLSDKLDKYFNNDQSLKEQNFKFFIAEDGGKVVGVAAIRKAPEHMKDFVVTKNPAELYVAAVKEKGKGIGSALAVERMNEAKKEGYTAVVLFSGNTHQESWRFHDKYFDRVGPATAPNGEPGFIWHKILD